MRLLIHEAREGAFVSEEVLPVGFPIPRIGETMIYRPDDEDEESHTRGRILDVAYDIQGERIIVTVLEDLAYSYSKDVDKFQI